MGGRRSGELSTACQPRSLRSEYRKVKELVPGSSRLVGPNASACRCRVGAVRQRRPGGRRRDVRGGLHIIYGARRARKVKREGVVVIVDDAPDVTAPAPARSHVERLA